MTNIVEDVKKQTNGVVKHRESVTKTKEIVSVAKPDKVRESQKIENALLEHNYTFRLRTMDDAIECNGKMLANRVYNEILLDMYDVGFKVEKIVNATMYRAAGKNAFHPIQDYLKNLTWDGQDHIAKVASYFTDKHDLITYADGTNRTVFHAFFRRWLIGAIGKVFNTDRLLEDYWQNQVLILAGGQGKGKSNFVSWLARDVADYFSEDMFNPDEKELDWKLSNVWIAEMSEAMKTLGRSDMESLKFKLTQKVSKFRKPYDRHFTETPNIVNPIATLNPTGVGFFTDTTGNRRFNTVELVTIDWAYSKDCKPSDVWAQAYQLYLMGETNFLSAEEQILHQKITNENTRENVLEDYLYRFFHLDPNATGWFLPTTVIIDTLRESKYKFINERSIAMEVAQTLTAKGFTKGKKDNQNGWYGVVLKAENTKEFEKKLLAEFGGKPLE